jgi:hypothetical protein
MGDVSTALIDRSRGQEFHGRVQGVLDAFAHWRRLIAIEMDAKGVDETEMDYLHFELIECGRLLRKFDRAGERMKAVREGGPWPL